MPTTYTPILKLALQADGENSGTWGSVLNANMTTMVEEAITGKASISSWSSASHTLTTVNGTTSESRCAILECTGAPGAAATVICPTATKTYIVNNAVSGGYAVTIKTASGSGVSVPNGTTTQVYCDGTNVVTALPPASTGTVTSVAASVPSVFSIAGSPITTSGTLAMTYSGTALPAANGGTGVVNTGTITLGGNLVTSGAFSTTFTVGATTNVTLPASGTLAILGANTFTGNQTVSDNQVARAMLIDCGLTYLDKGNSGTTTQTIDYTAGSHQKITATGNHTIALSNFPPTGNLGEVLLELANGGAFTITFPTINWIKPDGTTTTSIATYLAANTGRTALQSAGTDFIVLWSRDAGTTVYGKLV